MRRWFAHESFCVTVKAFVGFIIVVIFVVVVVGCGGGVGVVSDVFAIRAIERRLLCRRGGGGLRLLRGPVVGAVVGAVVVLPVSILNSENVFGSSSHNHQ